MYEKWIKKKSRLVHLLGFCLLIFLLNCAGQGLQQYYSDKSPQGSFVLVGIGPGDADLLTVRALEEIRRADIIFCNQKTKENLKSLIDFQGKQVLEGYGRLFPFYGKKCNEVSEEEQLRERMSCEEYHRKQEEFANLVRGAVKTGKRVVMLSSGDPTIYGPDMWTLKELKDIKPSVVPGLSAFNAASALLKVSLGEVIITASFKKEGQKDTIENLSGHERATMVIFMPLDMHDLFARLAKIYTGDTPVAIVSNAGVVAKQKVIIGTVGQFAVDTPEVDPKKSIVYVGKAIADARFKKEPVSEQAGKGKFYLVGMGPGDADLVTLRAINIIKSADIVFASQRLQERYASLLNGKKLVDGYGRLFPFYGKKCDKLTEAEKRSEHMSCEEYHRKQAEFAAMVRAAVDEGKTVVMLDSGDPLIYGPCAWVLTEFYDLYTEVVPGLSCFNAANAALRSELTNGKNSHSVILASGWSVDEMSAHQITMVLFTMRTEFKKFIDTLSKYYSSDTPVAIVISAGYAEKEKVIYGTLSSILSQIGENQLPFEYLIYVGDFLTNL